MNPLIVKTKQFNVDIFDIGQRIDRYLADELPEISRNQIQKLCDNQQVSVNGHLVAKSYRLEEGDTIVVSFYDEPEFILEPEDIPIIVLYEDEFLAVVDKPKGMIVYPGPGHETGTLANALLAKWDDCLSHYGGSERPGIVHRLDKDTSGLLLIAKTDEIHKYLANEIKHHQVKRIYRGIVHGEVERQKGTINAPIGRNPKQRTKMAVLKDGREAITHFEVIEYYQNYTQVQFQLETGRTHQIRVHMEYVSHPLAGDTIYAYHPVVTLLNGQCLHAYKIEFIHPVTHKKVSVISELPEYFTDFTQRIKDKDL